MASKRVGLRPEQNDYPTYVGLEVEPDDVVEVTRDRALRGKYLEPTAHAKANPGKTFYIVGGFVTKSRAIDAARKFDSGKVARTPGPAKFIPGEDPLNEGKFAVFCRYFDIRGT